MGEAAPINGVTGGCLCGAVRISARRDADAGGITACHCRQCQRWTGGAPLLSLRVADLDLRGQDAIARYHASEWGERAFCSTCGTTLYWKMQDGPLVFLALGLFDSLPEGLTITEELFVDHRADWLPAQPGATQRSEAEEQAALAAYLERAQEQAQ